MFQSIMTQSPFPEDISLYLTLVHEILVISLYFLKYENLHTTFPSEFSLRHYSLKHKHRS